MAAPTIRRYKGISCQLSLLNQFHFKQVTYIQILLSISISREGELDGSLQQYEDASGDPELVLDVRVWVDHSSTFSRKISFT